MASKLQDLLAYHTQNQHISEQMQSENRRLQDEAREKNRELSDLNDALIAVSEDNAKNKDSRRNATKAVMDLVQEAGLEETELWTPVLKRAKAARLGK